MRAGRLHYAGPAFEEFFDIRVERVVVSGVNFFVHVAERFVAALPEGGVKFGFLKGHDWGF